MLEYTILAPAIREVISRSSASPLVVVGDSASAVQLIITVASLLTAIVGFASAVYVAVQTGKKVDKVRESAQRIEINVNGNMRKLQAQFAEAIKELQEHDPDHDIAGILKIGEVTPASIAIIDTEVVS